MKPLQYSPLLWFGPTNNVCVLIYKKHLSTLLVFHLLPWGTSDLTAQVVDGTCFGDGGGSFVIPPLSADLDGRRVVSRAGTTGSLATIADNSPGTSVPE